MGCHETPKEPPLQSIYPPELGQFILSTRDTALSTYTSPGLIFKYGVGARNILNTFDGTYTLLADTGPSPSIRLQLSTTEVDSILSMMNTVGFFGFPDTFANIVKGGYSFIAGSGSPVYFGVCYLNAGTMKHKELWWIDHAYTSKDWIDERAAALRLLILRIRMLVEEKPAVREMPRPFRAQRFD